MSSNSRGPAPHVGRLPESRISRRDLLGGAAALGLGGLLAACGGEGTSAPSTTGGTTAVSSAAEAGSTASTSASTPARGGRLRIGIVGGGKGETFSPTFAGYTPINYLRVVTTFDTLTRVDPSQQLVPGLATEWTPNGDYSSWEFKLRPDVAWHDGRPLTADDVIYSLRLAADPKNASANTMRFVRLDDLKKTDDRTLVVPLTQPFMLFPIEVSGGGTAIVQDGTTDFTNPVGTGPFAFDSFEIGQRSLQKRNPSYWEEGKPYVDELEVISIDDAAARYNALLGGEIDVLSQIAYSQAKALDTDQLKLIDTPSVGPYMFYVRVDVKPFDDVRVRQALMLIPDRQALIDVALSGFGEVGNDLFGKGMTYYASDIPRREQDIEQARSLLKQAGQENLSLTLQTSPIVPGFVEAATLLKEQAKAAGVTIDIQTVPPNAYWNPSLQYLKMPFAQTYWVSPSIPDFYTAALLSNAPLNETHWSVPSFDQLVDQATRATSEQQGQDLWNRAQQIQWDQGGYLVWAYINNTDAAAANVMGIEPSKLFTLGLPTGPINAWLA